MAFKKRVMDFLSKVFPRRFAQPSIPNLPKEHSAAERLQSRNRHEQFLEEIAELPQKSDIDYALYRLAGHINDPLAVYRATAASALMELGKKIVIDSGSRKKNRALDLLSRRLRQEENTHISSKITRAIREIRQAALYD